jgi:hypothetical protein
MVQKLHQLASDSTNSDTGCCGEKVRLFMFPEMAG